MNRTQEQFFALLQSGLWGNPVDTDLFGENTNWEGILAMAKMQTVSGVLFDRITQLSPEKQPPTTLMRSLYQTVIRIEQSHELLNQALTEIASLLQSEGIRFVLLKGQGVAQNYPNPRHRQCGDIDLYVGEKQCEKARSVLLRICTEPENECTRETVKHKILYIKGINIDLHFLIDNRNSCFQRWFDAIFQTNQLREWHLNGTTVFLPPVKFDIIYIFKHASHHFISDGVGLRQLCDWAIYLNTFENQIDKEELLQNLKTFGLLRLWQIFGYIVVNQIGLSKEKFPFYSEKHEQLARKIVDEILLLGNFGQYNPKRTERPSNYFFGKLYTFTRIFRRAWHLLLLLPVDVTVHFAQFFTMGVRQVIKDKLKR